MKMKKMNLLVVVAIAFVAISCQDTTKKEYSWAYPVAGDWKVNAYVGGVLQNGGPYEIRTFNSSFGKDSIWVDDYATTSSNGKFWSFKVKTAVNINAQTFSTVGSSNAITGYPIKIVVSEGQVIGKDSITMKVVFEDDPTTTYQLAGHRETSYEDYIGK